MGKIFLNVLEDINAWLEISIMLPNYASWVISRKLDMTKSLYRLLKMKNSRLMKMMFLMDQEQCVVNWCAALLKLFRNIKKEELII